MSDLASVVISGLVVISLSFYLGMKYQKSVTNKNAIHIQTLPYSADEEPEEFLSIIVNDDLRGLINTGKSTVETWHSPDKTVITISMQ